MTVRTKDVMQRYKNRAAELVIITEALETLSVTDSSTYGKVKKIKGHYVTEATVQIYVNFEHKTALVTLSKNPEGGEWEALFDSGNGLESRVRKQRHQLAQSWIRLEH